MSVDWLENSKWLVMATDLMGTVCCYTNWKEQDLVFLIPLESNSCFRWEQCHVCNFGSKDSKDEKQQKSLLLGAWDQF